MAYIMKGGNSGLSKSKKKKKKKKKKDIELGLKPHPPLLDLVHQNVFLFYLPLVQGGLFDGVWYFV